MRIPLLLLGLFLVFTISCDEDDDNELDSLPVLSTIGLVDITAYTAKSGGNISDDGGTTVIARGVCWSTNENPTIDDNKTEDGAGTGSFKSSVNYLEPNTSYSIRAYATNITGTAYGENLTFTTRNGNSKSTFTDSRDGKVYQMVVIGNQTWMAENLAYAPSNGAFWAYNDDEANVETFGYLYDWPTACDVCPDGWHLPVDDEWTELFDYLGGTSVAGGKLKEAGTSHWRSPNAGASNETGFTALPAGILSMDETFESLGGFGFWWSATGILDVGASNRIITYYSSEVGKYDVWRDLGLSVRCVRD